MEDKLLFRSIIFLNCGKVSLPLIFLLVFLFSIAIAPPAAFALEGGGVEGNPYLIASQDDLEEFRDIVNGTGDYSGEKQNTSAHAKLTADITLTGNWTPIGNSSSSQYTGTFDGNGCTIKELSINNGGLNSWGLFGYVFSGGVVKNLTIADGIVGENRGTVQNCTNSGNVIDTDFVGGIVGINYGIVQNCENSATVSGSYCVGGIAGGNYNNGTVENCTNSGDVSGSSYVGGIVGDNDSGSVTNCLFAGVITDENGSPNYTTAGGVVGWNQGDTASVTNCAYVGISGKNYSSNNYGTEIEDSAIADAIVMTLSASINPQTIYLKDGTTDIELVFSADAEQVITSSALVALDESNGVAALESSEIDAIKVTPLEVGDTKLTVENVTFRAPDLLGTISANQDRKEGADVEVFYSVYDTYDTAGLTFTLPLTVAENRIALTAISLTEEV